MFSDEEEDDVVPIHTVLVTGGYIACLISAVCGIAVLFLSPGPTNSNGSLRYISEGFMTSCGWTSTVLGSCSLLIVGCQFIASAHMRNKSCTGYALAQAVGWFTVIGIQGTGWTIHYFGLGLFLLGALLFHFNAASDPSYGGIQYVRLNALAWLFSLTFGALAFASKMAGDSQTTLRSIAVSAEFVLLFFLSLQNAFLINSLDRFKTIHVRFERYTLTYA